MAKDKAARLDAPAVPGSAEPALKKKKKEKQAERAPEADANGAVQSHPRTRSQAAFAEAQKYFPGGVNSPVRSWRSVGFASEGPFFVQRGRGPYLIDMDGNRYVDFIGSWGPLILGHAPGRVVKAVRKQARRGASFGCPTILETRLAKKVQAVLPSMERMRFVSSGTEAGMHVLRVARGFTGREKVIKFEGCYHGASDSVLVKAGSGAATFGVPDSAGVPAGLAQHTLTVPFNNLAAVQRVFDEHRYEIAAVILEPVVGNAGVLPPEAGFLEGLSDACKAHDALLIFDEVMTGFRLAKGGAQERYKIRPDLTMLGKIIGGGLPCAAYGGRAEIMEKVAPLGPVYQAGTLSGNPLAMAAGLATLELLFENEDTYPQLERLGALVEETLYGAAKAAGWRERICINRVGSMFTLFFHAGPIKDFDAAKLCDTAAYGRYFKGMLERGVYMPPSQFEAAFLNLAMDAKALKRFARVAHETFAAL